MVYLFLFIGIFGLLGCSVLWPLLALPFYRFQRWNEGKPTHESGVPVSLLEIVIPAHNEAGRITDTLTSIHRSVQALQAIPSVFSKPKIIVHVAADGCTDQTAQAARQFPGVLVTESLENKSKWVTLRTRIAESRADWLILADAGVLWPESFLSDVLQKIHQGANVIGIAPSYRPAKARLLHRILWRLEMLLKQTEALCGGPISLHGATVGYKVFPLKKALSSLGDTLWLNDDVVIPMVLRALYPDSVILYPVGMVQDAGAQQNRMDWGRRKRLLQGNLQWLRTLWPSCFRMNPIVGVMAGRRFFRVLWAYWFGCLIAGLAAAFNFVILPGIIVFGLLMATSGSFRQLSGAALVSLMAPFLMIRPYSLSRGDWK
ncbi:MAG: glycosyltransferase [Elusimicrobiota bacterium]|jgi:glycosyltransferase involved in cell wall biosynthesis